MQWMSRLSPKKIFIVKYEREQCGEYENEWVNITPYTVSCVCLVSNRGKGVRREDHWRAHGRLVWRSDSLMVWQSDNLMVWRRIEKVGRTWGCEATIFWNVDPCYHSVDRPFKSLKPQGIGDSFTTSPPGHFPFQFSSSSVILHFMSPCDKSVGVLSDSM